MPSAKVCEADIIATGTELTYGQFTDTNSSWIADQLTQCGASVRRMTIIGDRIDDIVKAIDEGLKEKRRLIVITGGLGPTEDDLTVEAIAKTLGRETIIGRRALAMVRQRCQEFGIELTERRKRMARAVEGGDPLVNPVGLSPGTMVRSGGTTIVALPGIPKEMKPMFETHVLPMVRGWTKDQMRTVNLKIFAGDNRFPILQQIQGEFPEIYFKMHAKPPTHDQQQGYADGMDVTLLAKGTDPDTCRAALERVVQRFRSLVAERGGRIEIIEANH
jgi:molybdenum cofactor synthesis domain-containing protein